MMCTYLQKNKYIALHPLCFHTQRNVFNAVQQNKNQMAKTTARNKQPPKQKQIKKPTQEGYRNVFNYFKDCYPLGLWVTQGLNAINNKRASFQ
ncbi:rCG36913 [Rattus norvegicus]|uniref:RCG36913 n=1 Tax=Rattus norvegicus TaxID=10116 RepID=A6HUL9_RAT|nr:rCG36913 [Rattus norvegicus]